MQQSGGLLLAAGLDGGNTFIFLSMRKEKCKRLAPEGAVQASNRASAALSESQSLSVRASV
jgi:hypothetical protein